MKALGLGEQPVEADDRDARGLGFAAQLGRGAALVTSVIRGGERERGDFEAGVAQLGDAGTDAGVVPALERLVADGVFHGRVNSRARPDGSAGR